MNTEILNQGEIMKKVIATLGLLLAVSFVACTKETPAPVVTQPPVVSQPTKPEQPITPEVPCQKDGNFVVCDSDAVENCKYHNNINEMLSKAKAQGFKNCITYRGTEVMSGSLPCMACKKPGFND